MKVVILIAFAVCAILSVQGQEVEAVVEEREACGPVCYMYCYYGNYKDDKGCPICKCYGPRDDCSPIQCLMHCENGFVYEEGCPICKCR